MKRSLAILMCFAVFGACPFPLDTVPAKDSGSDDAGTGAGGGEADSGFVADAGLTAQELCAALNTTRCERQQACGLIADNEVALGACVGAYTANWCAWTALVDNGQLRPDAERVTMCLAALEIQACEKWQEQPEPCRNVMLPRVAPGQPCYGSSFNECTDDYICRGLQCPGTCQPRAQEGEPCASESECKAGLSCRFQALGTGSCMAPSVLDGVCGRDSDCVTGLFCLQSSCRALPAAGADCPNNRCLADSYCHQGRCEARKSVGEYCGGDECKPGHLCEPNEGRCVLAQVPMNELCTLAQSCTAGVCLGDTAEDAGVCAPSGVTGSVCFEHGDCLPHLTCADTEEAGERACDVRLPPGAGCNYNSECQLGAACFDGGCLLLPLPGEPCADVKRCRWGLCRDTTDGGAVCGPLLSAGATCAQHSECASGNCKDTVCLATCTP